ncbi:MAG: hypothetical protein HUU21_39110 [Polyangiaceae bacterium]|nr:hypothetical protein [Polyangiaceae bacterium]
MKPIALNSGGFVHSTGRAFGARLVARALFAGALVAAPLLIPGCSDKDKPVELAPPPAPAVLTPVPAPAGLAAELFLPSPDAAWKEARALIGGPAAFFPASFGGLVTSLLGLPIGVVSEIDEGIPAFGAITSLPADPRPRAALGVHVKSGPRFLDQLTRGEAARYTATVDPATSIAMLEPKGTVKGPAVFGVLGNYLLIGREAADLTQVGPYVARTMPTLPVPKEDFAIEIPEAAIAGPLTKLIEERRAALVSMGAALSPAVPVDRILGRLAEITPDLKHARVTVDLEEGWGHLKLSAAPKEGGGAASKAIADMTVGDTSPLRDLPEDTLIGLMDREASEARVSSAPTYAAALSKIMGAEAMSEEDRAAMERVLRSVAEARGDWIAAGAALGATGPVGYVRGAVGDKGKLEKAMKDLVGLAKLASAKKALSDAGFKVTVKKAVVEGIEGEVQRVRIEKVSSAGEMKASANGTGKSAGKGSPAPGGSAMALAAASEVPISIDLYSIVREGAFFAAAGYDAKAGFTNLLSAPEKGSFGAVPPVKTALDGLGSEVSFALVVDPLRIVASRAGKPGSAQPAPIVIGMGKGSGEGALGGGDVIWFRLDVAAEAVRELVKHRNALAGQ